MKLLGRQILIFFTSFMFGCLLISGTVVYLNRPIPLYCGTADKFVCGQSFSDLSEDGRAGKALFSTQCAACHKRYQNATGPALAGIDSIAIKSYFLNGQQTITDSTNMGPSYHYRTFQDDLSEEDYKNLVVYLSF
ncbi:MAG: cytochrome c [Leeuwenhoekiella sp.]